MTPTEAVLAAVSILLEKHKADITQANQVNIGINPKFGHGDDIWLRTELIHAVAEVTIIGAGSAKSSPKGPSKTELMEKVRKLNGRSGVTDKYLFVAENFERWFVRRQDLGDVEVLIVPGSSPCLLSSLSQAAIEDGAASETADDSQ
jgi:hypothetical protein